MIINLVKTFFPAAAAFVIGIAITPIVTHYLYKYKAWKKRPGKEALDGTAAVEFNKLHQAREAHTPRMGGIVIWASAAITTAIVWILGMFFPDTIAGKLNFLSRSQTWIPLFTLLVGAFVGLLNDIRDVTTPDARGLSLKTRLLIVALVSGFIGWWFYEKLGVVAVSVPFDGILTLGWLVIPAFMLISLAIYASGVIDGIDGLSGGIFASIFAAYAIIAFGQYQIDLAAFCAMMVGAILAFLWFNIPPARFWMTETGTMGITLTIAAVAFMTDTLGGGIGITVLPVIGALLVVTVLSNLIQIASKKLRGGKKVFRIAPLHHHFEAIGWPAYKVTMRYWVLSIILAVIGVTIALIG